MAPLPQLKPALTLSHIADANAGDDVTENICAADTTVDLNTLLIGADENGVFSFEGNDLTDANFDISTVGTYEFTYTVTNGN